MKTPSLGKLSFFQWLHIETLMVKREFKELPDNKKKYFKKKYEEYLKEE